MKRLLIAVLVFSLSACSRGTNVQPLPIEPSRTYSASYDATWNALIAALTELNFPVNTLDKDSGLINTGRVVTSRSGVMTSAHLYGVRSGPYSMTEMASVKALVRTNGDSSTEVRLFVTVQENIYHGSVATAQSKGILEKAIYDKIQAYI